jgi:pyruvate,water dikinase
MEIKRHLTLPLSDPSASLALVGGKGTSLSRLAQAGLPVPGGFHVTTEAYRDFVTANKLQPQILAAVQHVDAADHAALEAASAKIGGLFAGGVIPPHVADAIIVAYEALRPSTMDRGRSTVNGPSSGVSVAVRSSATAEDLPDASFAGQQETYLNIHGTQAVLEAVKKCWASLWTARAIAYRIKQGIAPEDVALAVVVQELVFADAAGIMFTANPINGRRDEIVINAAWGLGEAIVGGLVTPDTLTVAKPTGRVIRREIAEKQVMTVRTESGTSEVPVPDSRKKKPALTNAQAAQLARYGAQIETLYGMPMDIEWTLAGGKFAIVQARPITSLPEPPLEWPLPFPKAMLARGSFAEFVPEPVSPLFATLAVPIARQASLELMSGIGVKEDNSYIFTVLNDYVYIGMTFTPKIAWQMTVASFRLIKPMFSAAEQRMREKDEKFAALVQKWQACAVESMSPVELLSAAREIFGMTAEYYTMAQSGPIPLSLGSEWVFSAYYKALARRKGDPDASIFVFGSENHAIRSEKALFDLATWTKEQPALADYLARTPATEICAALEKGNGPAGFAKFSARFGDYLHQYGHAIYDLDFAKPVPAETPMPLLETLKVYLAGRNNPYERQQQALERRGRAAGTVARRLDPLRRKYFLKLLKWAQDTAPARENSIATLGLGHPQIRRVLGEFGRRLAAAGAIACADDVYWLEAEELETLAPLLGNGQPLPNFTDKVAARRTKWEAMRHIIPPTTLPRVSWLSKFYADNEQAGDVIKGFGASAGAVTARACVMLGPEDFHKMQPGDILVAGITTPAWTPLFARAAGIVTDIGGPLSHSSIVAREYGIPAVLATGVGTRRVRDGQIITVDGTAGTVTLHETATSAGSGLDWAPPNPKGVYMRTSIVDLMPNPLSPLFSSWALPVLRGKMKPLGVRLKLSEPVVMDDYYTSINRYAYMDAAFPSKAWWWIITRMLPAYPYLLSHVVSIWRDELYPEYRDFVDGYRSRNPAEMSAGELWRDAQAILEAAMYYSCGLLFATMGASAGAEGLLTQAYNRLARREGDPDASCLLMGWDNLPARAEKSAYDLAAWCREHPDLMRHMLDTPSAELANQLEADQTPGEIEAQAWQELRERLAAHFRQFGHIIFQMDFAEPLPLDHPEMVLETVRMYLRGEGTNPHERQQAGEQKRIRMAETMLKRLKGFKLWAFRKALNWGQSMAEVREDALAGIGLGYPLLRSMLHELGTRLARAGAIAAADDIYWLEIDEVTGAIARLEQGQAPDNLAIQVEQRKAFNEKAKQETPPPMIPMMKKYMGFDTSVWLAETERNLHGDVLKGVPTSTGKVTAPARVLRGPEDFGRMRPGDVLVAGTTTPAWTPLFAMAAAVVTDIGGPLSHGSIVAREYGIPAVMGTGVATRRIRDGQTVTVDGGAGTVSLCD